MRLIVKLKDGRCESYSVPDQLTHEFIRISLSIDKEYNYIERIEVDLQQEKQIVQ